MFKCARSSGVFLLLVVLIGFPLVIRLVAVGGPRAAPEREAREKSAERYDRPEPEKERVFRDYWVTPPDGPEGGTYQDVTIPFGFFGPECDGFEGRVHFVGSPLDPGTTGNADTVLERSADPVSARDAEGTTGTVTLRLTELSLVSKDPIAVECDDGLSLWHVHVGLSSEAPWAGWMTATKTHEDGGTFDSMIYVQPLLTFTNVDDPDDMLVFDMADVSDPAELAAAEVPFVLRVEASIARDDPDSVSGENVPSEFIPGIEWVTDSQPRMDYPDYRGPRSVRAPTPLVVHQAPGHQHCVEPTGACCHSNGSCSLTTAANCDGEYLGEGSSCGSTRACCFGTDCEMFDNVCCPVYGGSVPGAADCGPPNPCLPPPSDYWTGTGPTYHGTENEVEGNPLIPADFFGEGCDAFTGAIHFTGEPLDASTTGNADTRIERSDDAVLPSDPPGTEGTVDIAITGLSLVSAAPIEVTCDEGPQFWDVHASLSPSEPPTGWLTAIKTHDNGGTFNSTLYVQPLLTFTNVADPSQVLTLDTAGLSDPIEFTTTDAPFVHEVDPDLDVYVDPNSTFLPGVNEVVPGDLGSQITEDVTEEALWAEHGVGTPSYEPLGEVTIEEIVDVQPEARTALAPRSFNVTTTWSYAKGIQTITVTAGGNNYIKDCGGAKTCTFDTVPAVLLNETNVVTSAMLGSDDKADSVSVEPIRDATSGWRDYLCVGPDCKETLKCTKPTLAPRWTVTETLGGGDINPNGGVGTEFEIEGITPSAAEKDVKTQYQAKDNDGDAGRSIWNLTVVKLDLDIDANDDGTIDDTDEPLEMKAITDTPPGPYVNLNNDNDNLNTGPSGDPIEDKDEDGPVDDENDLRHIPLTLEPSLTSGYVTLKRANAKLRVWSDPLKGGDKKVLYDNLSKTWNLGDPTAREEFNTLKDSLYVEGREFGECVVSSYYQETLEGPELCKDENKITVCPGPPKEYPDWNTMSLIMAGGQLHNQWKHFSDSSPTDTYRVYIHTGDAGNDPFSEGVPPGLTPTVISSTVTYAAWDKGYIVKDSKKLGGFLIHFPARADEGKKYWVLVRAHDSTSSLESQNKTGYQVQVDYPDLGGGRSDLSRLNFYATECDDVDDIFLVEGASDVCSVCDRTGAPGSAVMWRVARSPRREAGAEGLYYADDSEDLAALKGACEGAEGIFAKNKDTFGDWSDKDANSKFFALVTGMFGSYGGYSWTWNDLAEPWSNTTHKYHNKSNYSDMVYLNETSSVGAMKSTFAHELQHNIHGLADPDEESWVNEGCSNYAEEINNLGDFSISRFGSIPTGEHAPRATKASLTRFGMDDVWDRFQICPRCERDSTGDPDDEGYEIWSAHYQKVAIWTHYLDKNIDHQPAKTIKTLVADAANGIAGVNNLSVTAILQSPDGPFSKWTVANSVNPMNDNVADKAYNYTGGWADVGVTAHNGTANGTYVARAVRNLAADYVKYTHTAGGGSLVVHLKDVSDWSKVAVNAVRIDASDDFIDVQQLPAQPVSPTVKKFVVPGVFGTAYKSVVIVVTNIEDTTNDSYNEQYEIKAQAE